MAQILEFRQRTSNTYHNLTRFVEITENTATLEFYVGALAVSIEEGRLFPGEAEKLMEQIRKKRLDLAKPKQKAPQEVTGPGLYLYCPEVGESRPECQIIAQRSHYGRHFHISTPLSLKGRGINFDGVKEAKNLTSKNQFMDGWNEYTVTERAFDELQEQYSISQESSLN